MQAESNCPKPIPMRVLTLNVYFGKGKTFRTSALLRFLMCAAADFVCLQEVTPPVHDAICTDAEISSCYLLSPFKTDNYGILMLVKRDIGCCRFEEHNLPSYMERTLLLAVVSNLPGFSGDLCIATSHFESLANAPIRRKQLSVASEMLRQFPCAVLCGDFNFDASRNFREGEGELENMALKEILPEYQDVWDVLHPREPGYTFDSTRNGSIPQYERMRYDRVLSRNLKSLSLDIVATKRLPSEAEVAKAGGWHTLQLGLLKCDGELDGSHQNLTPTTTFDSPPPKLKPSDVGTWLSDHFGLLYEFAGVT